MALKKYYQLLGLEENASEQEVRKKYRKLAMRFHPDKNPSDQAKEKFILLTDAYEIILGRKNAPPESIKHRSKEKTQEDRVKEARQRYHEQQLKEQLENERYYQSLIHGRKWRLIRLNALLGVIFSVLLLADLFLPCHYEEDRVESYARDVYSSGRTQHISLIHTEKNHDLWIANIDFSLYAYYPEIYIERSYIFHDPVNVISKQKTRYAYFSAHYTFHSMTFVAILIFLIPLFTLYYKRRTILFTIFWHLSIYFTGAVLIIFLLTNDHWAHLLTLGFL